MKEKGNFLHYVNFRQAGSYTMGGIVNALIYMVPPKEKCNCISVSCGPKL